MKIEIAIPKEFEKDFMKDNFKECFERFLVDCQNSIIVGRYERETLEMLTKAFKNAKAKG